MMIPVLIETGKRSFVGKLIIMHKRKNKSSQKKRRRRKSCVMRLN